jgi:RNA polymerase sigma factor (sigma-70 family)
MPTATEHLPASHALQQRLLQLYERTNDAALQRLALGEPPVPGNAALSARDQGDWISTCLMNAFKNTGDPEVFALLFELNRSPFLLAIRGFLRRGGPCLEANDVLQEVFLNIYSYPRRFLADRADAFRCWGHRIVRNTLLKQLRKRSRQPVELRIDDAVAEPEDQRARSPERAASDHEHAGLVNSAFMLFLGLYLSSFGRLPQRMQRVLTLAEVDCRRYRAIASELDIPAAHVKMLVYRSRQRILRGMAAALTALAELKDSDGPGPVNRHTTTRHGNTDSCWRQSDEAFE